MEKQCYKEVEVTFINPAWMISKNKIRTKDKMLMTPKALAEEKRLVKKNISPYSKIKVIRKVCDIKKWRGY
jgi:hypothetical protein